MTSPADIDINHDRPVAAVFEENARTYADSVAVAGSGEDVTYRALNARANRIAAAIDAACSEPGGAVALLLGHDAGFIAAVLGVLKSNRFYVPINAANPVETNRAILTDVEAPLLLTDRSLAESADDIAIAGCAVLNLDELAADPEPGDPPPAAHPEKIGGVFFTSGTTGEPKGVMYPQRNYLFTARAAIGAFDIRPGDRVLWGFQNGTGASVMGIFSALLRGAAVCPCDIGKDGAAAVAEVIERQGVTHIYLFRTVYHQAMAVLSPQAAFPTVRMVGLSGEQVFDTDVASWKRHFPAAASFINQLASTEAGVYRRYVVGRDSPVPAGTLPMGYAIADKEVLLWDEDGREVAPGAVGEIVIRSPYLAFGYWRRPDLTAAAFVEQDDGRRAFRSGDMGRFDDDGCLHGMGRKDDQVKVLGRRVELAAVEAALLGLEAVTEAAVVARSGADGQNRLIAFLVTSGPPPSAAELRMRLGDRLASAEIPTRFVPVDILPRLPNGKVDRKSLAARDLPNAAVTGQGPRDGIEQRLVEQMCELLKLPTLGIDDDLFEQGADSLTAIEVVATIERDFGVDLSTTTMWSGATTVATLADLVRAARGQPTLGDDDATAVTARPTPYAIAERTIYVADIFELALLPAVKILSGLIAEPNWRRIADRFARLTVPLRPGRVAKVQAVLASRFDDEPEIGRRVLLATHAAALERRMRMVSPNTRWRAPIDLNGRAHIEAALARGRGAILWLSPATFASIIGLVAMDRAGFPVSMVTRREHGLSTSRFGQAVLNRFFKPIGGSSGVDRILLGGDGQEAMEAVRRRLRENQLVAIAAAEHTDRPIEMPLLGGRISLAAGPPRLALATGAALLPVFARRIGNGFEVEVQEDITAAVHEGGGDTMTLMQDFVSRFEAYALRHPGEWSKWTHAG